MKENQFNLLIHELQGCRAAILEKLEEIRCGVIDVETEVEARKKPEKEQAVEAENNVSQ